MLKIEPSKVLLMLFGETCFDNYSTFQKGTTELNKIKQDFTIHQSSEGVRVQLVVFTLFSCAIYSVSTGSLQDDDLLDLMDNLS